VRAMTNGGVRIFVQFSFIFQCLQTKPFQFHWQSTLLHAATSQSAKLTIIMEFSDMLRYEVNLMTFLTKLKSLMTILAKHLKLVS